MTTDTKPIEERYLRGDATLDRCLETIMQWEGGCAAGKANALTAAYAEYNSKYSYIEGLYAMLAWIERMYPHAAEKWAELAGFEKVEPEPEPEEVRPQRGDVYRTTYGHTPYQFCLGSSQYNEGGSSRFKVVKETETDYRQDDWVAFLDCTEEGTITGSVIRWDFLDSFKRNYTKVKEIR